MPSKQERTIAQKREGLVNAVIGKVGPGTDGFRPRDQTRIKTPRLIRLFSVRQEIEESNR
jgi:hypothetical protein